MASVALSNDEGSNRIWIRFIATVFAGSFLLFLVQPMIARMALPRLGGAPTVWNSAMLAYQALLLGGYAFAHWLGRFPPRAQAAIQLSAFALAALILPIGLVAWDAPQGANSFVWVPWLLLVSIGPLFFVISAQAPLMQRWFHLSGGGDPYPLYAASNLGSFFGLLAYPLLVEPLMPIASQSLVWSIAYAFVAIAAASCALAMPKTITVENRTDEAATAPSRSTVLHWIALAAIPSGLMLSTTLHITTDIVAMPMLWVLPLGIYLLSFTVAFSTDRRLADRCIQMAPITLLLAAAGVFSEGTKFLAVMAAIALLNLFVVSTAIHAILFQRRPPASQLTRFYLALSVGGVVGGLLCALIAPLIFDWTYEHPILMVAAALAIVTISPFARLASLWNGSAHAGRLTRWTLVALLLLSLVGQGAFGIPQSLPLTIGIFITIMGVGLSAIGNRLLFAAALAAAMLTMGGWSKLALSAAEGRMTRSYFGIYSIRDHEQVRMLVHGTTIHGVQNRGSPEREKMATTYYAPFSGVGLAVAQAPAIFGDQARIGVVGLGAGTLSCYARPGQRWTFYEIDPAVVAIARDENRFTFLARCHPRVPIAIGDARLTIAKQPPASTDMLIVDAFSSDSVPMHLLTWEAFETYRRHLQPNGLLLVHISNRHLDLEPVVDAAARRGWWAAARHYQPNKQELALSYSGSLWIALSPSKTTLEKLQGDRRHAWRPLHPASRYTVWSDDYGSILPIIKWQ